MIIVEGPDGGGKTRLARRLSRELGYPIAPRVVAQDTTIVDGQSLKDWVEENVKAGFQRVIFDRHRLISEPIYGPIMRRGLRDGFDEPIWFTRMWRKFMHASPVVVWCLPDLEVVRVNCASDPDNEVVRDHLDEIYWQYWTAMCRHEGWSSRWNYESEGYEGDFDDLTFFIKRHIERMTP